MIVRAPGHQSLESNSKFTPQYVLRTLLLITLFAASTVVAQNSSVTLAWDSCTGAEVVGHRLYWGVASRAYTNLLEVGKTTNATVAGLISGVPYYFAVTAFDAVGLESDYSTEVSFTPAALANPTISITSPASGASYTAPATVSFAASVTANGHAISKVQFYNGTSLLGENAAAPYTYTANNVASGGYSITATAIYDSGSSISSSPVNVIVTNAPPATSLPLPSPWQSVDIGAPGTAGSASLAGTNYAISGAGSFTGTSDQLRFAYQPMTGKGEVRVRLLSQQSTGAGALAGIMIRETLAPGSRYAFIGLSPTGTVQSRYRALTSASTTVGASLNTGALSNVWLRLIRSGSAFYAYSSSDGVNWQLLSTVRIQMATTTYAGLAVGSGSSAALNAATFDNVIVVP